MRWSCSYSWQEYSGVRILQRKRRARRRENKLNPALQSRRFRKIDFGFQKQFIPTAKHKEMHVRVRIPMGFASYLGPKLDLPRSSISDLSRTPHRPRSSTAIRAPLVKINMRHIMAESLYSTRFLMEDAGRVEIFSHDASQIYLDKRSSS